MEGIFQTTLDGKYVAVNPALARMYGYDSPDDMIATITNIASQLYVDPGRRDEFIRLMQAQEEVTGFEALVYRKDGSFIWISENVRACAIRLGCWLDTRERWNILRSANWRNSGCATRSIRSVR